MDNQDEEEKGDDGINVNDGGDSGGDGDDVWEVAMSRPILW